jgi:isoleucyl-tRNA synthetase
VLKSLEVARRDKLIGSGLEAQVTVSAEGETLALLRGAAAELSTLFIVSKVALVQGQLSVKVERAPGEKCERCWIYAEDRGGDPAHPTLCGKCTAALA